MQTIDVNEMIKFDPARPVPRTLIDTPQVRILLFCLEAGQELPAHGADSEVAFYTLQGRGVAIVGDQETALRPGVLVRCPPQVPHGLRGEDSLAVMAIVAPRPW